MATTTLRPDRHEDRLSLVEHLDELRKRLIICVVVVRRLLRRLLLAERRAARHRQPPARETAFKDDGKETKDPLERTAAFQAQLRKSAIASGGEPSTASRRDDRATRATAQAATRSSRARTRRARATPSRRREARKPVTLGVAEPFTATVRVAAYAALLLALPLLLYQAYAFVLPAFSPRGAQDRAAADAMVPFLFIAGVVFAYFVVLPHAIDFLQNFNDDNFDILLQARTTTASRSCS